MPNFVLRPLALVLALSFLSGCVTASSKTSACPPVIKYSRQFQKQLAAEIDAAPLDAVWPIAVQDYGVVREQLQSCKEGYLP